MVDHRPDTSGLDSTIYVSGKRSWLMTRTKLTLAKRSHTTPVKKLQNYLAGVFGRLPYAAPSAASRRRGLGHVKTSRFVTKNRQRRHGEKEKTPCGEGGFRIRAQLLGRRPHQVRKKRRVGSQF